MSYYRICPHCGAHLDSSEVCDCAWSRYSRLTEENKRKVNEAIDRLIEKQKAPAGAANTDEGGVEQVDKAVSTFHDI